MSTKKRATFSIVTITLTCPCGGECVSPDNGSTLLVPEIDPHGVCSECGKTVKIPKAARR